MRDKMTNIIKYLFKISGVIAITLLLNACQSPKKFTEKHQENAELISYSDYYLWLKTLSSTALLIEVKLQEKDFASKDLTKDLTKEVTNEITQDEQAGKLILIYSLPTPDVYKPYKAKTLLNSYPLAKNLHDMNDVSGISKANFSFMIMLRDQLNNQLNLRDEQAQRDQQHQVQQNKQATEIIRLNKQLAQLKAIEKNINNHISIK